MPGEVIRYVDPNSTGGNGTTNELSGPNAAYSSLYDWDDAEATDITSLDVVHRVICSSNQDAGGGSANTTAVTLDSWTTDDTRYIQIESASSHGGKWNDNIFRISYTSASNGAAVDIRLSTRHIKFVGIQIEVNPTSTNYVHPVRCYSTINGDYVFTFDKCIMRMTGTNSRWGYGVQGNTPSSGIGTINSINCQFYGFDYSTYGCAFDVHTSVIVNMYNTTIVDCTNSWYNSGGGNTVNAWNVGQSNVDNPVTGTTCSSTTPTFVDPVSYDYHLQSSDTTWKDQGTTDPGTGLYSDDIDGQTRSGTWDIGADEYISTASQRLSDARIILEARSDGTVST